VGARASAKRPGSDKGKDGELTFQEGGVGSPFKRVLISVKSGGVSSRDVRDLYGAVDREKAAMGWLITLERISIPMRTEAAEHGFYESPWGKHQRIQVLTVEELLQGKKFDAPPIRAGGTTFKTPRRADSSPEQGALL